MTRSRTAALGYGETTHGFAPTGRPCRAWTIAFHLPAVYQDRPEPTLDWDALK